MSGKVVGWAFDQICGSPVTKFVLVKLADNANDEGYCFPSAETIVRQTELSLRSVREHLRILERLGLIEIIERRKDGVRLPSHFQLNLRHRAQVVRQLPQGSPSPASTLEQDVPTEPSYIESNRQDNRHLAETVKPVSDPPKKVARKVNTKTLLPEQCPTSEDKQRAVAYWSARGRRDLIDVLEDEAERFRANHQGRGTRMADWSAAWTTWYSNALRYSKPPQSVHGSPSGKSPTAEALSELAKWIVRYADDGKWIPNKLENGDWWDVFGLGPPPHMPGTKITEEQLRRVEGALAMRDKKRAEAIAACGTMSAIESEGINLP